MTTAADLIKHYLKLSFEKQGVKLDNDCYWEMESIAKMLEDEMRAIARDEIRQWVAANTEA